MDLVSPCDRPTRVILIVLDSVGVGELPDAGAYGDEGSDTLGNISQHVPLRLPTLRSLGLARVAIRSTAWSRTSPERAARSDGWRRPRPAKIRSPGTGS